MSEILLQPLSAGCHCIRDVLGAAVFFPAPAKPGDEFCDVLSAILNLLRVYRLALSDRVRTLVTIFATGSKGTMFGWLRREPASLIEHRCRMRDALADYPIYEPPHRQGPNFLRRLPGKSDEEYERLLREFLERGRENFVHFVDYRHERLTALGAFLAKFNVNMGIDDEGLAAVSAWCPHNCGALVANYRHKETRQKFFQHLEPWTDRWRGFNVVFDLGVFFGECVMDRNPRLHWIYTPGQSDDGSANHSGYGIAGFRGARDWLDPAERIYGECTNDENHILFRHSIQVLRAETLVGMMRDYSTR